MNSLAWVLSLALSGCGASHSREAEDSGAERPRDAGVHAVDASMSADAAVDVGSTPLVDAGSIEPVECVVGTAHLAGRTPFGDAGELVFAWAEVVECLGADEVYLSLSSTDDRASEPQVI